jgi:hypothetical protein
MIFKGKDLKKSTIILIAILFFQGVFANVNFIDLSKISKENNFVIAFKSIKDNLRYYDHWTNEWNYNISKQELISKLHVNYSIFSAIGNRNEELDLLLGDIAHYLYNLDDSAFYDMQLKTTTRQ